PRAVRALKRTRRRGRDGRAAALRARLHPPLCASASTRRARRCAALHPASPPARRARPPVRHVRPPVRDDPVAALRPPASAYARLPAYGPREARCACTTRRPRWHPRSRHGGDAMTRPFSRAAARVWQLRRITAHTLVLSAGAAAAACAQRPEAAEPLAPDLGVAPPATAEIFAPGTISDERWQWRLTFTAD